MGGNEARRGEPRGLKIFTMEFDLGKVLRSKFAKRVARAARTTAILGAGGSLLGYLSLVHRAELGDATSFYLDFNVDEVVVKNKTDSEGQSAFKKLMGDGKKTMTLLAFREAIEKAKNDPRCSSLVLRSSGTSENKWLSGEVSATSTMQEVRSALAGFAGAKPAYAAFSTFGELGTSNGLQAFTLASVCRVSISPSGHLSIPGYSSRAPFFRDLLDKWGIEFYVVKRNQYKNALNNLTERGYTRAHREATEHLLGSIFEQCVRDISDSLGMAPAMVKKQVDKGVLTAREAKECGLIHDIAWCSEVMDRAAMEARKAAAPLKAKADRELTSKELDKYRVPLPKYANAIKARATLDRLHSIPGEMWRKLGRSLNPGKEEEGAVALLTLNGPILNGSSGGSKSIDSSKTVRLLRKAGSMKKVKAVVLRVNSPGGSVVGSDEIHHAISELEARGKRVVISMGDVCASGGYYISAPASKIFAMPGTLTGSIGVIMGKLNFQGFLSDLGVRMDPGRNFGKNAGLMSQTMAYTRAQTKQINHLIDDVYLEFLSKVSSGRGLSMKMAKKVANGRVWTGEDAYRLGLVDALGGLEDAIRASKEVAGLGENAKVVRVKEETSFFRDFGQALKGVVSGEALLDYAVSSLFGYDVRVMRELESQVNGRPAMLEPAFLF